MMNNEFPDEELMYTPNDEFDLLHQDEYELLRELEGTQQRQAFGSKTQENDNEVQKRSVPIKQPTENNTAKNNTSTAELGDNVSVSQVSVNDFINTPVDINQSQNAINISNRKKRTVEEILYDVDQITKSADFYYGNNIYENIEQSIKRPRWDQPDEIIKVILAARKKHPGTEKNISCKNPEFKLNESSISKQIPCWNFIPVTRTYDGQRLYIKIKNIKPQIDKKRPMFGLLSIPYDQLKAEAEKIITKNIEQSSVQQSDVSDATIFSDELWVDKYRPKKYIELLSDESVNSTFLRWLKLWDKIVFNREPIKHTKQNSTFKTKNKKFGHMQEDEETLDEKGFPKHRIALLTGPPGLGKTTLAHVAAKHAGYNIVEINASDDRSPEAFREALLSSTQMQAVLDTEKRPNCLVLDEIDGAPSTSIDLLLKFVQGKLTTKGKKNKEKTNVHGCRRPVVCICNELYTPSLRPLRAAALIISVQEISPTVLTDRLMKIARKEGFDVDRSYVQQLVEKSGCDIRSCLGALQFMGGNLKENTSLAIKDSKTGLFDTWREIFQIPMTNKGILSLPERARKISKMVQQGENDKLAQGVFHNYPILCKNNLSLISESMDWFQFFDTISTTVASRQVWMIMPYVNYAFIAWHFNFAGPKYPKLTYPTAAFEMNQKLMRASAILTSVQRSCGLDKIVLCLDILPFLPEILNPRLRSVSAYLYSAKENAEMERLVNIMLDYGLSYIQEKKLDGGYEYNLDPNIYEIAMFPDCKTRRFLPYAVKQILIQELEVERLKRAANIFFRNDPEKSDESKKLKAIEEAASSAPGPSSESTTQKLSTDLDPPIAPPPSKKKYSNFFESFIALGKKKAAETKAKTGHSTAKESQNNSSSQPKETMIKSCVWYKFKEGFSNAIRRNVLMEDII